MDYVNAFIQIVNGVGFPIAACIGMAFFIVWDRKTRAKENNALYSMLKTSIDNNTTTLQKLVDKMEANNE